MELFTFMGKIAVDDKQANRSIDDVMVKAKNADEETSNSFSNMGKNFQTFGKKAEKVGGTLTKKLSVPLAGIGAIALKVGSNFQAGMSEVEAISGATGQELEALTDKAKEMGAKTKFSATESAEAMKYMAMAGWKTKEMLDGIDGVMDLAAASGEDLGTTSDIVTDALTAFGMKANEAGKFADLLASASSNSNTNVGMMGETFKYVAPIAGSLGYTAEDTALAVGLMANSGIKASQAGTTLRGAITRLVKPSDDAAIKIKQLGLNLTDSNGKMLPFKNLMDQLRDKFSGLTEEQKAQYAATIFGQEAMSGMLAIINASEEDYRKVTKATRDYNGAAKDMAETMQDNLQGKITALKSKLEGVGIQIAEILIPSVIKLVEKIQVWVDKFSKLNPKTQEAIVKMGLFAASMGPVLIGIGKLNSGIGGTIGIIGKLVGSFNTVSAASGAATGATKLAGKAVGGMGVASKIGTALLNPWTLAIGAAALAGYGLYKTLNKDVIPEVDLFADKIEYSTEEVVNSAGEIENKMVKTTTTISEETKKQVGAYMELNDKASQNLMELYTTSGNLTKEKVKEIANDTIEVFKEMGYSIKQELDENHKERVETLKDLFKNSKDITKEEQAKMFQTLQESNDKEKKEITDKQTQITEIVNNAMKERGYLKQEEKTKIGLIQDEMNEKAINVLSENEVECKLIMERIKEYGSRITAEQAQEVIKNANEQREKAVEQAEKEYEERMRAAIRLRAEGSEESKKLADKIEEEAKRQKKESIDKADELKEGVVKKLQELDGDIEKKVNIEDGSLKKGWQNLSEWFNKNPIIRTIKTVMQNSQKELEGSNNSGEQKVDGISGAYATGTTNAKHGLSLVGEEGPELVYMGGGETVLNNKDTMNLLSKIGKKTMGDYGSYKKIGKDFIRGLTDGINENKPLLNKSIINIGNTIWDNSKQWSSKYGKDVVKVLGDTIKNNSYEPEEAAKTVGDKVNTIVKQKQDNLKKELDKMNIESKAKVDALQRQLQSIKNEETVALRGVKGSNRYGIQDGYRAQKQAIEDKIKAVKNGCSKEVKVREETVKKEIELIKRGGQQATEELRKESEARKEAVQNVDKLNDLILKSLTRKMEKERDVALETAKLKAKESNLTKNQLDSLFNYTKNYYDKKLERDKLQAQAEQLIMSKNQKAIVELLNNYGDLYQDSGMTLGQRMVGGMKSWTDMVPGIVGDAMGKVENSVQQTSVKVENSLTGIMSKIATVGKAMLGVGIAQPKKENSFDNIFSNWENTWQEDKDEDVAKKIADKYKEAFNRIELAQIELGRETKNSDEELKKQQATLDIQKDKLSTLKNKYDEMKSSLGSADDEVVSLKKDIASLTIEIENQGQKLAVDTIKNEAKEWYEALELSTLKLTRETKNFNDELDLQKDLYINHVLKLGAMEEEYEKLKNILGEDSDAVRQLQKDIISFNNEMASFRKNANSNVLNQVDEFNDKVKNALKARYESSLATEENYFNTRSESVSKWKDENINAINAVYDARIKALDDGLKAEDRSDNDKEELKRINRLKEAISFEHNEFNKAEMNKELSKLIADRNKRLHKESVEDEKASLDQKKQNEINNINKSYEEQRRGLERQLQSTRVYYSEKLKLANLEAEAQKLIVGNNQAEIIKLLKEYDKDYEEAGKTLGERLADGMAEQIYVVLDMIENIGDKLKNIRTNEIEKALSEVNYTALSSIPGNSISNSTTNNSNKVINNNSITFNSPKALSPSEQRRETETTLRNLVFGM